MHLSGIVSRAPVELLLADETTVLENERLLAGYRPRIQHRRSVASWSGDRLWEELQAFSRRSKAAQCAGEIDHAYAEALVEALARCDIPDAGTVCRLLAVKDIAGPWLEMFLINIAGERRLTEAIPLLVDRFHVDTDYMLDQCVEVLAKLGDPEAVRLIREAFPRASWNFKNYTSSRLGDIKHPDSEEAIVTLLETERNVEIRTDLCLSLCNLFSERGIEIVRAQIQAGYDGQMVTLDEVLLPVAQVLGVELPEAERWRQERDERDRFQATRRAELESTGQQWAAELPTSTPSLRPESASDFETERLAPFRRHDPKVGRNDPCPCGSGKKVQALLRLGVTQIEESLSEPKNSTTDLGHVPHPTQRHADAPGQRLVLRLEARLANCGSDILHRHGAALSLKDLLDVSLE